MYNSSVILILFALTLIFTTTILFVGKLCSLNSNSSVNEHTNYECGNPAEVCDKRANLPKYYTFAILFIVYNAEILLLFPFALAFGKLHSFVFLQTIIFILIMLLSISYAMRKKLLRFR